MTSDIVVDALVVGSGAAGLMFARELSTQWNVLILTKAEALESNTKYAQGGIAAVINIDDDYQQHIDDTLIAGAGLCDIEAVKVLVHEAPARIRDLIICGVEFDRSKDNRLLFTREGGHKSWRVLHVGDMTGKAIEECLEKNVIGDGMVRVWEHAMVVDLIIQDGVCFGVWCLDRDGNLSRIIARTVFLATGGLGQLYARTTNPDIATGDGTAMAYRAHATVHGMEFIQFHPTTFYQPPAPAFLISEAVRGEGGILINHKGERFVFSHHPDGELAPRDIVSRAIYAELKRTGVDNVFLDVTGLASDFVRSRFPTIYARCLEFGVDITKQPIPVAPAAHYCCGGVKTDIDGKTDIMSLYAGGEVAYTGVHGANRLASNSLLESVVFAYRAAVNADRYLRYLPQLWNSRAKEIMQNPVPQPKHDEAEIALLRTYKTRIQDLMWQFCGIVRYRSQLKQCLDTITKLEAEFNSAASTWNLDRNLCELRNLFDNAKLVLSMALARKDNVGTHFCLDDEPSDQQLES